MQKIVFCGTLLLMTIAKNIVKPLLIIFAVANLAVLNYFVFFVKEKKSSDVFKETTNEKINQEEKKINSCPDLCLEKIKEATESIKITPGTEKVIEKTTTTQTIQTENGLKEWYIPLGGSGSTDDGRWEDISGMEVYIDKSKYPKNTSFYFEASLKVKDGNGEAHARLFNVTTNTGVDYSEITSIGGEFKRAASGKINISSGNNLYRVQMFSTTQYEVYIEGPKVKVMVE